MKRNRFHLCILLISITGGLLRLYNLNYASLWADEIYSLFSVHPSNSWYEVLYWQRALQPPLYFIVLWVWVKAFAFNEFYARLLSFIAGVLAIVVSGYLGRRVKNEWVGIGMAIVVAFAPIQIWYSLEARFYVFVYLFATLSLLIYYHLIITQKKKWLLIAIKSAVDAALCYFHHFGIVFVFAQFCFDLYLLYKEQNKNLFLNKFFGYVLSALLYLPWVVWGLTEGLSVKQYWLTEIDIPRYFMFGFSMSNIGVQYAAVSFVLFFLVQLFRGKLSYLYFLFPAIVFVVILVPVVYSYVKFPILVDRYAMVMSPVLYLMFTNGVYEIIKQIKSNLLIKVSLVLIVIGVFSFQGVNVTFFHKEPLQKTPFRQMAEWIKKQPDYRMVNVYTYPVFYKNFILSDFYLNRSNPSLSILSIKVGEDKKMYLVGGTDYWRISDSLMSEIYKMYRVTEIDFLNKRGVIYACDKR